MTKNLELKANPNEIGIDELTQHKCFLILAPCQP